MSLSPGLLNHLQPDPIPNQPLTMLPKHSAILTKYTSLRSFHEATNRGSPLDYENAGIYTSSLLDAYMVRAFDDPERTAHGLIVIGLQIHLVTDPGKCVHLPRIWVHWPLVLTFHVRNFRSRQRSDDGTKVRGTHWPSLLSGLFQNELQDTYGRIRSGQGTRACEASAVRRPNPGAPYASKCVSALPSRPLRPRPRQTGLQVRDDQNRQRG